jgi:hypothetical protein
LQTSEQPSFGVPLPSSHSSPDSTTPLPQTAARADPGLLRKASVTRNASASILLMVVIAAPRGFEARRLTGPYQMLAGGRKEKQGDAAPRRVPPNDQLVAG